MASRTNSQKSQAPTRSRSKQTNQTASRSLSSDSSPLTSIVESAMSNVGGGRALQGTVTDFAAAIDDLTDGNATELVTQLQEAFEHGTMTAAQAKETFDLSRRAFQTIRKTSKKVFANVKENPEPFIAAAVPVVVGLLMLMRKSQSARIGSTRPARRTNPQNLNA